MNIGTTACSRSIRLLLILTLPTFSAASAASIDNITQATTHPTIQDAINNAFAGDVIEVSPGTYNEIIDFVGKAITVRSTDGEAVTTIDATGVPDPGTGRPVVRCDSGETAATVLQGFTITGGAGDTSELGAGTPLGLGMYINSASPTVRNCIFDGNANASGLGGGIYTLGGSPTVTGCKFSNNTAGLGGGMFNNNASPIMDDCLFTGNGAVLSGGAMYNIGISNPTIAVSAFIGNMATSGGAVYAQSSGVGAIGSLTMSHCRVEQNTSQISGPGVFISGGTGLLTSCFLAANNALREGAIATRNGAIVDVVNCTVVDNTNTDGVEAAGVTLCDSTVNILNTIIYGNAAGGVMTQDAQITLVGTMPALSLDHSLVQGLTGSLGGTGNIDADPQLAGDNLHLLPGSPCIDAGDPSLLLAPPGDTDIDGEPRIMACVVDIGADEVNGDPLYGDLDGNGVVDQADVVLFANALLGNGSEADECLADMNADDTADGLDLQLFLDCLLGGPCP